MKSPRRRHSKARRSSVKLKSQPEDFQVEEISRFKANGGPFAVYRLIKRSLGTPEAIQSILRAWNISLQQVSYGGLKDRHAETRQTITIRNGPPKNLTERNFHLEYLGQASRPFTSSDIETNRFHVTLRNVRESDREKYRSRLGTLQTSGMVNYFDDQRFGSLGVSGRFIAQAWCLGDYEKALYLAMAEENPHDRPREKEQKAILRDHWGDWNACKTKLDRSHRRSIVTYLVDHPTDFRRAIALIRSDLRSLYMSAFQSYLWNRLVSDELEEWLLPEQRRMIASRCGPLVVPTQLDQPQRIALSKREIPLPSARIDSWEPAVLERLEKILQPLGMNHRQLRVKYPRDTFFSKGLRPLYLSVEQLHHQFLLSRPRQPPNPRQDRPMPVTWNLELRFDLPRGSYATMIIKAILSG